MRGPSFRAARTEEDEEAAAVATQKPGTKSQHPRGEILLDLVLELTHVSPLMSKCGDAKGWDTLRREGVTQGKVKTSAFGMN